MTLAERIAQQLGVQTDRYMFGLFGDEKSGAGGFGKLQILGKTKHVTRCQNCGRAGLKHAVVCAVVGEDGHPTNQYYYFGSDCASKLAGKAEKDIDAEAEEQEQAGRPRMKKLKPVKPNEGQMELGLRFAAQWHSLFVERYGRPKPAKGQMGLDFDALSSSAQPTPQPQEAIPAVTTQQSAAATKGRQMGLFEQPSAAETASKPAGFEEQKHPRWEAGDKQHHGGQFAPKEHKPHKHGQLESAENVLNRVKSSPQHPRDLDWARYASRFGIEGDFKHVDGPMAEIAKMVQSGHLRMSQSLDDAEIARKVSSGSRNPVIITNEPGRNSLVVDGTHSLIAAMQAGDETVKAIVPASHALAAGTTKESKSELAINNPPFRDFRYVPKHRNAGSLYPNRPGQLFTDEQQQQLKNWARQNGMMVSSDSGPGAIHVVHNDHRSRLDLTLHGAEGVKREAAAVKSKQAAEQESARKQQVDADLAGRAAAGFINESFGDSLNTYNKTKLADFLEGKDKKFGGLWGRSHVESLQKLGAVDSSGQVNLDAIRKAFEQHGKAATGSGPQEPWQMTKAEAKAAGHGDAWSSIVGRAINRGDAVPDAVRAEFDAHVKAFDERTKPKPQAVPKAGDKLIRFTHKDGTGLLNNSGLDRSKLSDNEEQELVSLMDFGLHQPPSGTQGTFHFTEAGEKQHARMLQLLSKASKTGVVRTESTLQAEPSWVSEDGQVAVHSPAETRAQEEPKAQYFKGDEIRLTGKTDGDFEEFEYLEGHKKGQTGLRLSPAASAAQVEKRKQEWKDQQAQFARLHQKQEEPKAAEGHEPYEHERYPGKWLVPSKAGVRGFGDTLHSSKDEAIAESHRVAGRLKSQQEATAKAESQEKAEADRKAAFKASGMTPAQAALQARVQAHLGQQVSAQGNVTTRQALLDKELAEGHKPTVREVPDEAARAKAAKEAEFMLKRGVPTGNESHPDTIKLRELQAKAKSAMKQEHVMEKQDGAYRPLSKMEHDYAAAKYQPKAEGKDDDYEFGWLPENHVKIAADSIQELRRGDVFRLFESAPQGRNDQLARYINKHRPDLSAEVHDALVELNEQPEAPKPVSFGGVKDAADELQAIRNELAGASPDHELLRKRVDAVGGWIGSQKTNQPMLQKIAQEAHQLSEKLDGGTGKSGNRISIEAPVLQLAETVPAAVSSSPALEPQVAQSVGGRVAEAIAKRSMDFGRKVEVRKDRAVSTGPKAKKPVSEWDLNEGWASRYKISQVASSSDPSEVGKFVITDSKQKGPWYAKDQGVKVGGQYATAEEAKQAVPLIEVARNHRVYQDRQGQWHIYRKIGDRHVSVKPFASEDEAKRYMAENPREIIQHKFPSYETYQYLDRVERQGPERRKGSVNEQDFQQAFAPGGAVFGNWMTNKDGVTAFHHAYDSLHDLADVLDLHPHQVSIDGDLVYGFGAAGSGGKNAARAHYEPGQQLINLTKMAGAGSLAHEWWHGLEHHIAKKLGLPTHTAVNIKRTAMKGDDELADAVSGLYHAMHYTEDTGTHDAELKKVAEARAKQKAERAESNRVSREKGHSIIYPETPEDWLHNIRMRMKQTLSFKKKDAKPELMKQYEEIEKKLASGDYGDKVSVPGRGVFGTATYSNILALSDIHKKITGRGILAKGGLGDEWSQKISWSKIPIKGESSEPAQKSKPRVRSKYLTEAEKLDSTRSSRYYTEPHEMAARAFESYVADKLKDKGIRSDYLIGDGKTDNGIYKAVGLGGPFPEGEERKQINAAFDKLIAAVRKHLRKPETERHSLVESAKQLNRRVRQMVIDRYGANELLPEQSKLKTPEIATKPEGQVESHPHWETPEFKSWFGSSHVKTPEGKPLRVFHGTKRPDRVQNFFNPKRATSGPMSFFTDNPAIASSYASSKQDTSLEHPQDYGGWFKYRPPGRRSDVNIDQAWNHLPQHQRQSLLSNLPRVTHLDDEGNERPEGKGGFRLTDNDRGLPVGRQHWEHELKQARGNALQAAKEIWLNSGMLYGDEEKFLDVLKTAGMHGARFESPWAEYPSVYPVHLSIQNPLDTANIPDHVHAALQQAGKRKRGSALGGVDQWDKRSVRGQDWLDRLARDRQDGTAHAWTSIPDWVTKTLMSHGYDGIKDTGGKQGGEPHNVWIPFHPHQVKSAIGNRGSYSLDNKRINFSASTDVVRYSSGNESETLEQLQSKLKQQYPALNLFASERPGEVYLHEIGLPKESRGQGIGRAVIEQLKGYAQKTGKPITLTASPESGKKGALSRFYKSAGFEKPGRKRDFSLAAGHTHIWHPEPNKPSTEQHGAIGDVERYSAGQQHDERHVAVGKRFGIPPEAVKDVLETHPDELARRHDHDMTAPSSPRNEVVGPTLNHVNLPLGSVKIGSSMHRIGDTDNAYVDFLREFNPQEVVHGEHEDGISNTEPFKKYVEWFKMGHKPPPINVYQSQGNKDVSSNRRRLLAAQKAGVPSITGWYGVTNQETGLPLKYGDVKRAFSELNKPALNLFGEPVKPASKAPASFDAAKAKQGILFAGLNAKEGQMNLFADAGVPDDLVAKPQQPAQKDLFSAVREALIDRYGFFDGLQSMADNAAKKVGNVVERVDQAGKKLFGQTKSFPATNKPSQPKSKLAIRPSETGVKAGAPLIFNADHSMNNGESSFPKGTQGKLVGGHEDPSKVVVDVNGQHHAVPKSVVWHDTRHTDHKAVEKSQQEAQQAQAERAQKFANMTARQQAEAIPEGADKAKRITGNFSSHELQEGDIIHHGLPGLPPFGRVISVSADKSGNPDGKHVVIETAMRSKSAPDGIATTGQRATIPGHEKIGEAVASRSFPVQRMPDEAKPIGQRKQYQQFFAQAKSYGFDDDTAHNVAMDSWNQANPKPKSAESPKPAVKPAAAPAAASADPKPRHHVSNLQAGDTIRMLSGPESKVNLRYVGAGSRPGFITVEHPQLGKQEIPTKSAGLRMPKQASAASQKEQAPEQAQTGNQAKPRSHVSNLQKGDVLSYLSGAEKGQRVRFVSRSDKPGHVIVNTPEKGNHELPVRSLGLYSSPVLTPFTKARAASLMQKNDGMQKQEAIRQARLERGNRRAPDVHQVPRSEFAQYRHGILAKDKQGNGFLLHGGKRYPLSPAEFDGNKLISDPVKIRERIHRDQVKSMAASNPNVVPPHVRDEYDHHWSKWTGSSPFAKSGAKASAAPTATATEPAATTEPSPEGKKGSTLIGMPLNTPAGNAGVGRNTPVESRFGEWKGGSPLGKGGRILKGMNQNPQDESSILPSLPIQGMAINRPDGSPPEAAGQSAAASESQPAPQPPKRNLASITRPFNAGANRAMIQFDSELQRDLHDLAAARSFKLKHSGYVDGRQPKSQQALNAKLSQIANQHFGGDEDAASLAAMETLNHVKRHMKGVQDGEHRIVPPLGVEVPKPATPSSQPKQKLQASIGKAIAEARNSDAGGKHRIEHEILRSMPFEAEAFHPEVLPQVVQMIKDHIGEFLAPRRMEAEKLANAWRNARVKMGIGRDERKGEARKLLQQMRNGEIDAGSKQLKHMDLIGGHLREHFPSRFSEDDGERNMQVVKFLAGDRPRIPQRHDPDLIEEFWKSVDPGYKAWLAEIASGAPFNREEWGGLHSHMPPPDDYEVNDFNHFSASGDSIVDRFSAVWSTKEFFNGQGSYGKRSDFAVNRSGKAKKGSA